MTSNPWLKDLPTVPKCPTCDVRLFNGKCIDHGPPQATAEQQETEEAPDKHRPRMNLEEIAEVMYGDDGVVHLRMENDVRHTGHLEGEVLVIEPVPQQAAAAAVHTPFTVQELSLEPQAVQKPSLEPRAVQEPT